MTRIFFYGVYVICLYIVNNFYIGEYFILTASGAVVY